MYEGKAIRCQDISSFSDENEPYDLNVCSHNSPAHFDVFRGKRLLFSLGSNGKTKKRDDKIQSKTTHKMISVSDNTILFVHFPLSRLNPTIDDTRAKVTSVSRLSLISDEEKDERKHKDCEKRSRVDGPFSNRDHEPWGERKQASID
ncbi:hypothetical protein CRE_09868 [Caenorhabditis remanei]|uniref:Uncharacterized protein n=1 Tax=Caenorhabditis remanei TaxID=31234 RepID=E3NLE7_CAERE|nr:hypothetical protein CRE_09868 [Caenorhabditis remanei]